MTTQRFLIENHGPIIDNFKMALSESIKLSLSNCINQITLVVPAKGSFPDTIIGKFFGQTNSKLLCKGESIKLGQEISINLKIPLELRNAFAQFGVVLATYLVQEDMHIVDELKSPKAIVYLPWMEDSGKKWLACWEPTIWGASTWAVESINFTPAVEDELNRLNSVINLSTGLTHPSDKKEADNMFKQLSKNGHYVNPEDIKYWAIKNGWDAENAKSLEKLATKYFG